MGNNKSKILESNSDETISLPRYSDLSTRQSLSTPVITVPDHTFNGYGYGYGYDYRLQARPYILNSECTSAPKKRFKFKGRHCGLLMIITLFIITPIIGLIFTARSIRQRYLNDEIEWYKKWDNCNCTIAWDSDHYTEIMAIDVSYICEMYTGKTIVSKPGFKIERGTNKTCYIDNKTSVFNVSYDLPEQNFGSFDKTIDQAVLPLSIAGLTLGVLLLIVFFLEFGYFS